MDHPGETMAKEDTPLHWLRTLFFLVIVRPLVLVIVGLNVRNRRALPFRGPAILAANHNSHLDTLALMSLFPLRRLPQVRPVAAADYFLRNRWLAWFSQRIIGILPLKRGANRRDLETQFAGIDAALERGDVLILFPEGSRGEPEQLARFKTGLGMIACRHPTVPVIPILLHGLGKSLPKGEAVLVPFFCDVFIGDALQGFEDRKRCMGAFEQEMQRLAEHADFPAWE